jgi:hypothetical protein
MVMKKLLPIIFIACFCCGISYGQLRIDTKQKLNYSHQSIIDLVNNNHFEYALISWGTSTWLRTDCDFKCLLKQNGKWYLAFVSRLLVPQPEALDEGIKVKERQLTQTQADSILKIVKPDSAFRYTQADLDKLPPSCSYMKDGKPAGLYAIYDAGTSFLMQLSNNKIQLLSYYAAENYLSSCYPYLKEFGILKGLVNTTQQMYLITKDLSKP